MWNNYIGQDENLCKITLLTLHWRIDLCGREFCVFVETHLLHCLSLTSLFCPMQAPWTHGQSVQRVTEQTGTSCDMSHYHFSCAFWKDLRLLFSKLSLIYDQPALAARLVQAPRPISEDLSVLETSSSRWKSRCCKLNHLVFCNQSLLQSIILYCLVD